MNAHDAPSTSVPPAEGRFAVTPSAPGTATVGLGLSGEFDIAALDTWRAGILGWPDQDLGDVVVDLLRLRFLDASGMGALVVLANSLRAGGHRLSVARPAPNVLRALTAGGLSHLVSA